MALEREGVSILGSTGSIGKSAVGIMEERRDRFFTEALVANKNAEKLADQAKSLGARFAVVADESAYPALKEALFGSGVEIAAGAEAVAEAAARPAKRVVAAIVGAAGLASSLVAIRRGAIIGLANKETLVAAGALVTQEVKASGAVLVPVDSEHSAIFQTLEEGRRDKVDRIILTASGGPFRTLSRDEMRDATPAKAVAHPNWSMGAKISVDSATMMNKGLEIIEAVHLFGFPEDRIDVIVHPQSAIHSMVSYQDGSILAQMGAPDMKTPISLALGWPERLSFSAQKLDLARLGALTFEEPDIGRFPALELARRALRMGGGAAAVLNAANEVAVGAFLKGDIGFLDIAAIVQDCMDGSPATKAPDLESVMAIDRAARIMAETLIHDRTRLK